jgi:hypothetical protein
LREILSNRGQLFRAFPLRVVESTEAQVMDAAAACTAKGSEMKRKRKNKLEKGTEARRRARASGLLPPVTQVVEDKRRKPSKHKKDWLVVEEKEF